MKEFKTKHTNGRQQNIFNSEWIVRHIIKWTFSKILGLEHNINKKRTFEGNDTSFNQIIILQVSDKTACWGCPKLNFWYAQILCNCCSKAHNPISNYATDWRHISWRVKLQQQLFERAITVFSGWITQQGNVLRCILIRRWQSIGYGLKYKIWETLNKLCSMGPHKTLVVELGVHKGYVETLAVKEFREFHEGIHMALRWVRYAHNVRLWAFKGLHFCGLRYVQITNLNTKTRTCKGKGIQNCGYAV